MAEAGHQVLTERLDSTSDRAVLRQIADHLRSAITSRRLREGDHLPSEAQLMDDYGITRMTVRHALDVLKAEGLVVSQHGRGVFVRLRPRVRRLGSDRFARRHREAGNAAFIAEVEGAGARPTVDRIVVDEQRPDSDVAGRRPRRQNRLLYPPNAPGSASAATRRRRGVRNPSRRGR